VTYNTLMRQYEAASSEVAWAYAAVSEP
jgi:hypothetical protein